MRLPSVLLAAIAAAALSPPARSDVVTLSGAENARNIALIAVEDDRIEVQLEVFLEDLEQFRAILPDDRFTERAVGRESDSERRARSTRSDLRLIADGETLPVEVRLAEARGRVERYSPFVGQRNPTTGSIVPGPPSDPRVLYIEFVCALPAGPRPSHLRIVPPLDERGNPSASIGFTVEHKGVQVVDFKYLSMAADLRFAWDDPWYSRFDQPGFRRWQLSGMMTFLYVEPYEVRHEMLVRIKDVMPLLDLDLRDPDWIEEDEFRRVEEALGAFLLSHSNVLIDDRSFDAILDRIHFVESDRRTTRFLTEPERLEVSNAKLGVVIAYPTKGLPQEVAMTWDLFTDRVQEVPANAIDPAGPLPTLLTPEDPVHLWRNFLKTYVPPTVEVVEVRRSQLPPRLHLLSLALLLSLVPVLRAAASRRRAGEPMGGHALGAVALLAVAAASWPVGVIDLPRSGAGVDEEEGRALLTDLLSNVYRAFDFRAEEDVYDRLAVTVAGDLLGEIYLENRSGFEVRQAGGARARVEYVDVESAAPQRARSGIRFDATWTAAGSVGHWGHVHQRTNRYVARLTVEPRNGAWKITEMDVLDEVRIDPSAEVSDGAALR
ncbi:MAG: hypothetical protein AAGI22_08270 [Planctomycetota bacterium]